MSKVFQQGATSTHCQKRYVENQKTAEPSQSVCLRIGMRHCGQTRRYYNALCELFEAKAPAQAKDHADAGT